MSLIAFDLLELNGEDVRPAPLTERKRRLKFLLQPIREGIELGEHLEGDGAEIYRAACSSATRASWRSAKTCRMKAA